MARKTNKLVLALAAFAASAMSNAALASDIIDCSITVRKSSEAACTRIINQRNNPRSDRFMAHFNRAWFYLRSGERDKALGDFNAAEKLDRNFSRLYLSRAQAKRELSDFEGALADLDVYSVLEPSDWNGHYQRAEVERRLYRTENALKSLAKAIELKPYERSLKPLEVLLLSDLGRQSDAAEQADRHIAVHRSDPTSRYARAIVSFRRNAFDNALADIKVALQTRPLFPAAYALRAQIHELRGDIEEAKRDYEKAMKAAGPTLDLETAQETASRRLDVLSTEYPSRYALQDRAESAFAQAVPARLKGSKPNGDCRRYVPSANATVSVRCGK